MAMPGWGPVDDGPWIECEECGALLRDNPDYTPICDECWVEAVFAADDEEGEGT